jgi:hypothetical protein
MTVAEAGPGGGLLIEVEHEAKLDTDEPELRFSGTFGRVNANLSVGPDPSQAKPLLANEGIASPGVKLHGSGFIVTPAEARALGLGTREGLDMHIRPYRHGRDLLQTSRNVMVIDLFGRTEPEVRQRFPQVYQHLLRTVKPERDANRRASYRDSWWIFGEPRRELRPVLAGLRCYIATVETSKHRIFQFVEIDVLPDNKLTIVASDDAYHLGVLCSRAHRSWYLANAGMIGVFNEKAVWVKASCWDPFPFPDAMPAQRARIAALAEELDSTRKQALAEVPRLTMTEIYNWRERIAAGEELNGTDLDRATAARAFIIHRLHEQIDAVVADAYGWSVDLAPSEIVARLVALNAERKAEEEAGTIRWLRPDYQAPRFG